MTTYEEDGYIHLPTDCQGHFCPFHNPSSHHMQNWPKYVRTDAFAWPLTERICPHGIGHPDPDSLAWLGRSKPDGAWGVHGCDRCCSGQRQETVT